MCCRFEEAKAQYEQAVAELKEGEEVISCTMSTAGDSIRGYMLCLSLPRIPRNPYSQ